MGIKKFNEFINESIRDQMVSKSDSEVKNAMDKAIKEFELKIEKDEYINVSDVTKLLKAFKNAKKLDNIDLIIFLNGIGTFNIDILLDALIDDNVTGTNDDSVEDIIKKYNDAPRRRLLEILEEKGYIESDVVIESTIEELIYESEFEEVLRLLSELKKEI